MMAFAPFVSLLEVELGVDLTDAAAESLLREDLSFDSLLMVEVLVLFDHHGVVLPDDLIPELRTLADLHHYFNVLSPAVTGGLVDPAKAVGS